MKNSTKRVWILGASDPEMEAIESLLKLHNEQIGYGVDADGRRVTPRTADHAWVSIPAGVEHVISVECRINVLDIHHIHINHHRPGDPGYGMPPSNYWCASSIGQVVELLRMLGSEVNVSKEMKLIAAADHCLVHAYAAQCPGISPGELREFRIKQKAKHQNVPVATVRKNITIATAELMSAKIINGVADMTGKHVPELPEAAAYMCQPFLAGPLPVPNSNAKKYVLQAATASLVKTWLETDEFEKAFNIRLVDKYGDPARGFAGGYTI